MAFSEHLYRTKDCARYLEYDNRQTFLLVFKEDRDKNTGRDDNSLSSTNEGKGKYYQQLEARVHGVCGVEIRKGLPREPAALIKAVVLGWIHPCT